jgi:hypothetical protein
VHVVAAVHETEYRTLAEAMNGLGVAWTAQLLPFQPSARVTVIPKLLTYNPTAVQAVLAVHETPFVNVRVAPLGVGVDWTAQPLPFQPSARLTVVLPLL